MSASTACARRASAGSSSRTRRAHGPLRERVSCAPRRVSAASRCRCVRAGDARRPRRVRRRTSSATWPPTLSARFNDDRYELMRRREALDAELSGDPDPIARSARASASTCVAVRRPRPGRARAGRSFGPLRERWLDRILGEEHETEPASYHVRTCGGSRRSRTRTRRSARSRLPRDACRGSASTSRRGAHPPRPRRPPAEEPAAPA
jgi:hypothetical protein